MTHYLRLEAQSMVFVALLRNGVLHTPFRCNIPSFQEIIKVEVL